MGDSGNTPSFKRAEIRFHTKMKSQEKAAG